MSIKLIATDLDGTLLNEKGEVSALTRKVFLRAQQEGIRIVLATGRDLPYFSQAREALHTDMFAQNFYIALNGARIADLKNGQEQRTQGFVPENVDLFLKLAADYDLEALCYAQSGRFRYARCGFEQRRLDYLKQHGLSIEDNVEHLLGRNMELETPHYPETAGSVQKIAYLHSSLRLQQLLTELRAKLPAQCSALLVTPCWVEIVPDWLNKESALQTIMQQCGILPEEAAAFGDGENDIKMLKSVTHGYAMSNAFPSVLEQIPLHAPANREDGVAKTICKLCGYSDLLP